MLLVLRALSVLNSAVLGLGRQIAWMALGLMVVVILLQAPKRKKRGGEGRPSGGSRGVSMHIASLPS